MLYNDRVNKIVKSADLNNFGIFIASLVFQVKNSSTWGKNVLKNLM